MIVLLKKVINFMLKFKMINFYSGTLLVVTLKKKEILHNNCFLKQLVWGNLA